VMFRGFFFRSLEGLLDGWNMDLRRVAFSVCRVRPFWRFLIGVARPFVFAGCWCGFSGAGSTGCCDQLLSLIGEFFFAVMDRASVLRGEGCSIPEGTIIDMI
jgi:hypothetical protein